MRGVVLTACSLIAVGFVGVACDNDPVQLGAGTTAAGGNGTGGDTTTTNSGGDTSSTGGNTTSGGGDGGDGGMGMGGGPPITVCMEDLAPQEGPLDIVITEVSIGNYIEVYNPTANTKDLGAVEYQAFRWCARPDYPTLQSTGAAVSIPPGGYRTIPWPTFTTLTNTDGELALYTTNANGYAAEDVADFVCWGNGNVLTRKPAAELAGEWTGDCAASTDNGVIRRANNTNGSAAADWDSAAMADPTNCDP